MKVKDNYLIRREEAKKYFLEFDHQEIIDRWKLKSDATYIYVTFLNEEYRISRESGQVECGKQDFLVAEEAGFEEVLAIFDLLCHAKNAPAASENWAVVNSLKGRPRAVGVQETRSGKEADLFDSDVEKYKRICREMGGREISLGDVGFEFAVFQDLKVRLKFYCSDEEFRAQIILLWPENALEYLYYETTFYILGFLLKTIAGRMEEKE